jgi:hypothetical protein
MQSFLQKLEALAGEWLDKVEEHSQPIAVQIMTGAVFTDVSNPHEQDVPFITFQSTLECQESEK